MNQKAEEMELLEVLRDNQLDVLGISKPKTAMDLHIEELLTQYRCITSGVNYAGISRVPRLKLQMSEETAGALLCKIEAEAVESFENKIDVADGRTVQEDSKADSSINRELFFKGIDWTDDQKETAEYMRLISSIRVSIMSNC